MHSSSITSSPQCTRHPWHRHKSRPPSPLPSFPPVPSQCHPNLQRRRVLRVLRRRDGSLDLVLRLTVASAVRRARTGLGRVLAEHATETAAGLDDPLRDATVLVGLCRDLGTVFAEEHVVGFWAGGDGVLFARRSVMLLLDERGGPGEDQDVTLPSPKLILPVTLFLK